MHFSNPRRFQQQVRFLRRQFLQDGDLPFTDVLSIPSGCGKNAVFTCSMAQPSRCPIRGRTNAIINVNSGRLNYRHVGNLNSRRQPPSPNKGMHFNVLQNEPVCAILGR